MYIRRRTITEVLKEGSDFFPWVGKHDVTGRGNDNLLTVQLRVVRSFTGPSVKIPNAKKWVSGELWDKGWLWIGERGRTKGPPFSRTSSVSLLTFSFIFFYLQKNGLFLCFHPEVLDQYWHMQKHVFFMCGSVVRRVKAGLVGYLRSAGVISDFLLGCTFSNSLFTQKDCWCKGPKDLGAVRPTLSGCLLWGTYMMLTFFTFEVFTFGSALLQDFFWFGNFLL